MTLIISLIIASIIDIPSFISILGAIKARSILNAIKYALIAGVVSVILSGLTGSTLEGVHLLSKFIGQILLAFLVFGCMQKIRRIGSQLPSAVKRREIITSIVILTLFGCSLGGVIYFSIKRAEFFISEAKIKVDASRVGAKDKIIQNILGEDDSYKSLNFHQFDEYKSDNDSLIASTEEKNEITDSLETLYIEPVESSYWNNWSGRQLADHSIYIGGEGKTVSFKGILHLNCQNRSKYQWGSGSNFLNESLSQKEINEVVPLKVIEVAFDKFCI